MVTFAELLVITCIWSSYLFINAVVESCIYKLSHSHTVTSVVRTIPHQWEKAKLPLSPHAHSLTDSHQILHTWLHPPYLPHAAFGQDCPRGYFSPYSQSYHTFLVISLWAKSFYRPTAQAVEPILTHDTPTDAYSRSLVPFHIFALHFWVLIMVSLWQIHIRITAWCIEIRCWNLAGCLT